MDTIIIKMYNNNIKSAGVDANIWLWPFIA